MIQPDGPMFPGEIRTFDTGIPGYQVVLVAGNEGLLPHVELPEGMITDFVTAKADALRSAFPLGSSTEPVEVALAYFASEIGETDTPRAIFFVPEEDVLEIETRQRNLTILQKMMLEDEWGQTPNQDPDVVKGFDLVSDPGSS